ncbi:MAG TPA: GNAT family N-acetyltransferase [Bryobacteraceae bacterium]|nr:GNAT family N-acetyltransferase [Bryobacteraceae bacterium]
MEQKQEPGEPRSDAIEIRAATAADLASIVAIQNLAPDTSHWEPSDYLHNDCVIATEGGRVMGFLLSRQIAVGEREILNLAVAPAARRRGVARKLLKAELASTKGVWFLEVRESNAAALGLYQRFGFQQVGKREAYYQDPLESGIVMRFLS